MEPKANFALVGIFVVVSTIITVFILLWLIGVKTNKEFDCYVVKTENSISGLDKDASVRYKGVNVGKVSQIKIDSKNPEFIDIYINVEKDLPIKIDTKAKISSNGLTGISYVNLIGGSKNAKMLKNNFNTACPIIKTVPTTLEKLSVSASEVMSNLNKILTKIDDSLGNDSINSIRKTIKNISSITDNVKVLTKNLQDTSIQANRFLKDSDDLAVKINTLTKNINGMVTENKTSIKSFTSTGLENLNDAINQLQNTLYQLRTLTNEIKQNPSLFIKGQYIEKGPGE